VVLFPAGVLGLLFHDLRRTAALAHLKNPFAPIRQSPQAAALLPVALASLQNKRLLARAA
jgi:hypothetical protein